MIKLIVILPINHDGSLVVEDWPPRSHSLCPQRTFDAKLGILVEENGFGNQ